MSEEVSGKDVSAMPSRIWHDADGNRAVKIMQIASASFTLAQILGTKHTPEQVRFGICQLMDTYVRLWPSPEEAKDDMVAFAEQCGLGVDAIFIPVADVGKPGN